MKKLWSIAYFSFIPATIFTDFYHEAIFIKKIGLLEAISNLILIFYYVSHRKSKLINNDWLLIEALLFTAVGGIVVQLYENQELLMFINTVGFYLTQFTYISIFRKEGSILPPYSSAIREWQMLIISIVFAFGLLILLIPYVPDKLLVISFVYSTQMLILVWMAYFRPTSGKSYKFGMAGVTLLVISNVWLTINLLAYKFPYMIFFYFSIYAVSQYFIVESILKNANLSSPSDNPS
jgi:YhhN family